MRVLVLTSTPREPDNHLLWKGLARFAEVEVRYIDRAQQKRLGSILRAIDATAFDRVVVDLLFRYVHKQVRILRRMPGLMFYEEDAWLEFTPNSRWRGKFSAFYRQVPHARVVMTGFHVAQRFKSLGVDAHFLVKGYDSDKLYDAHQPRDIELGFIGRLGSNAYRERRAFLQRAADQFGLAIMRTEPGDAYREALNRIKIFVSADIDMGEYMAKNFEAMACGCALLAYRQSEGEVQAIGLVDGGNVMLYESEQEFDAKLAQLRADPPLAARIAQEGRVFAEQHLNYFEQSKAVFDLLSPALPPPAPRGFFTRWWLS